jgi:hypothetical protein
MIMIGLTTVIAATALIFAMLAFRKAGGGLKDLQAEVASIREKAANSLANMKKQPGKEERKEEG